jgi:hypothetical protein
MITQQNQSDASLWPKSNNMPKPQFHSYLLRLWQESTEKSSWRFVLVNLTSNEQRGFASLERLIAFLQEQMDEISASDSTHRNETEPDEF